MRNLIATLTKVYKYRILSVALTEAHPAKSREDGERRHRSDVSSARDVEHHKRKDQHHRCLTAHDDKLCDHVGEHIKQTQHIWRVGIRQASSTGRRPEINGLSRINQNAGYSAQPFSLLREGGCYAKSRQEDH
uniref:Uncharacterized protein n=1 Tax=Timema poppense TaxID=170557 RepID=A0A7R9H7M9_TIMPO|nr:unnamed protein product [Timema poppensis]